jgi:hypothetical protein
VLGVIERHGIDRANAEDVLCSMNLWGMPTSFVPRLRTFVAARQRTSDDEVLLPDAVQAAIDDGLVVRVVPSDEQWAGMTNPADIELARAHAAVNWPSPLW